MFAHPVNLYGAFYRLLLLRSPILQMFQVLPVEQTVFVENDPLITSAECIVRLLAHFAMRLAATVGTNAHKAIVLNLMQFTSKTDV